MLLIKNNKVYVNKSDVRFMLSNYKYLNVPDEVLDTIVGISDDPCTVVDSNGKVYKGGGMCFTGKDDNDWIGFSNKVCKEYFNSASYMIDYEYYLNMDDEQLDRETDIVATSIQNLKDYSNSLSNEEFSEKIINIYTNIEMYSHQQSDITTMKNIRNGFLNIPLPPDEIITDNGPTGPGKVDRNAMKHVWFAEKAIFKFNLQDIYKHTYIRH